ncbi:hypothetical protein [Thiorhodococcus drewsii]|uniref:hypothetical protein n=1 Tax=Thiorhodococcus drewsii TaxID=210408 RepID=UPI0005947290|nr:hypothetical protein [Thiorhodococcus drewsii]
MAAQVLREQASADQRPGEDSGLEVPIAKTTGEVIALAKHYVESQYLGTPGFRGAHLVGSIIHSDRDALFPTYCDVDIAIVLDRVEYQEIEEIEQEGYVLECILSSSARYASADAILALPGMACNLEKNSILVDPDGYLNDIHRRVAAEFSGRRWVKIRTEDGVRCARSALDAMRQAANPAEAVHTLGEFIMHCSESITVAHLNPPTHRRTLANLRALLSTPEELALYEEILTAFGVERISEHEARRFLDQCLQAFDRAIEVKRSPVPFEWKLDPCIRDYLKRGTLEMIEEGAHRESLFWIALFFMISTLAIQQDGTPEERPVYGARLMHFLQALGLESPTAIGQRIEFCSELLEKVESYVDRFVATSSALKD